MISEALEIELPSGATLILNVAPFKDSKALYQALMAEAKTVPMGSVIDVPQVVKDVLCTSISSPVIDAALNRCMLRCAIDYGDGPEKINDALFEPVARRDDYLKVQAEVVKANVLPFVKSLYVWFTEAVSIVEKLGQKSESPTTT